MPRALRCFASRDAQPYKHVRVISEAKLQSLDLGQEFLLLPCMLPFLLKALEAKPLMIPAITRD